MNKKPSINTSKSFTVYCDMDGVLCDFPLAAVNLMNNSLTDKNIPQKTRDLGYKTLDSLKKTKFYVPTDGMIEKEARDYLVSLISNNLKFWANLPWMKNGQMLWSLLKENSENYNLKILTTPTDDISKFGKISWVKENLGDDVQILFSHKKHKYANQFSFLIDDKPENIHKFSKNGGFGLWFHYDISTEIIIHKIEHINNMTQ